MKNLNKYLAEFIGTFTLAFVVALSLAGTFPVPTPVLAGLTLGLFVYSIGHISGTHINPAITLGALSIKKISAMDALYYWIAQFLGAALAFWASSELVTRAVLTVSTDPKVLIAEAIGTFFFAFGVAAVIYGRVPKDLTGIAVGGSLLMGISIAASVSNGVLNPAVAFGIGSFSLAYLVGPLVGAVLGMWAFKLLSNER